MEKPLYPIGEVAKLTGVPIKTIRYYSDIALLPPTGTTTANYRLYSTEDIWRLQLIRVLRQIGFRLEDIRAMLSGNLPIAKAIDWQLEVLDEQLQHITRIKTVLQQAQRSPLEHPEALHHIHNLGMVLTASASERNQFISEKLQAIVKSAQLPPAWHEYMLQCFTFHFSNEFSPEQTAAWVEIVSMLHDPTFVEEALQHNEPFRQQMEQPVSDMVQHNEQMLTMLNRAQTVAQHADAGTGVGNDHSSHHTTACIAGFFAASCPTHPDLLSRTNATFLGIDGLSE